MIRAQVGRGHVVWLIVDTGADGQITLPNSAAADWPDIIAVPMSGRGLSSGVGGTVESRHTWLTRLRLLGVELMHVPVSFEDSGFASTRSRVHIGRIGGKLLNQFRLTFDPSTRQIWASWQPAKSSGH